jgi:hypothetical protein
MECFGITDFDKKKQIDNIIRDYNKRPPLYFNSESTSVESALPAILKRVTSCCQLHSVGDE